MTPSETIGLIVGLLAILDAGFVIGKWRANRQRDATLDDAVATRIRNIIGTIEITLLGSDAREVLPAQTIAISYDIVSKAAFPFRVWLGASLVEAGGSEHFDQSQDKEITLEPGHTVQSRYLTIPSGIQSGNHRLYGAVWLGARGSPENSIRLARRELPHSLRVR